MTFNKKGRSANTSSFKFLVSLLFNFTPCEHGQASHHKKEKAC